MTYVHYTVILSESTDLFDKLARQTSTCVHTRQDGGEIGWIDNPHYKRSNDDGSNLSSSIETSKLNDAVSEIISNQVIEQLFQRRVKGGDVLKLPIITNEQRSGDASAGWHVLRVDDLHLRPITTTDASSKNVVNKVRPKLKGSGAVPLSPLFQKRDDVSNAESSSNIVNSEVDREGNAIIYTIPDAKYYKIVTTGCQMNVADSERIMGVLENELGLTSLDQRGGSIGINELLAADDASDNSNNNKSTRKKETPDILLLNTCTIRDHAEQKVYDALGPYAAMKRAGKPLAIVVAGCVAQQEG
jgi:hypothetical protein